MSIAHRVLLVVAAAVLGAVSSCDRDDGPPVPAVCEDDDKLTIFEDRIAPLLKDGNKSTCNECHLAGVDLGLYSKGADECTTMACMVESGIVDLEHPESSVVLTWILRGVPASMLITADVVQQEHDGMLEWIRFQSSCGAALCEPVENPCGDGPTSGTCETPPSGHDLPPKGFDDPGDCSDLTLERGFGALIYSWRGRCYPCHYDTHPGDPMDAPRWIVEGDCNIGALASMRNVIELGVIDVENPEQSLLLLKPLAESAGGVEHGGSDKFFDTNDGAYQDFLAWIERYAACNAPG
jgi:hypothetical protein